jgi:signal transduction histidine kinase
MSAFALAAAAVILLAVGFFIWRRWIEPWKETDELVRAIVARKSPRKFLMTGNQHAHAIGLALENLSATRRELEARVHEGETSVEAVLGAMLDGLAVVDEKRRVRMVNREFQRVFNVGDFAKDTPLLELIRHGSVDRLVAEAIRVGLQKAANWKSAQCRCTKMQRAYMERSSFFAT